MMDKYKALIMVLNSAYYQAAHGKGNDRHANGENFENQPIITLEKLYKSGCLFQAAKKMHESQRLEPEAAINELLGSINYLAGRIIVLRENLNQNFNNSPQQPEIIKE
jgi:hypothetical protein